MGQKSKELCKGCKKKSSLHYQWVVKNELFDKDLEMKTLHCKICKKKININRLKNEYIDFNRPAGTSQNSNVT